MLAGAPPVLASAAGRRVPASAGGDSSSSPSPPPANARSRLFRPPGSRPTRRRRRRARRRRPRHPGSRSARARATRASRRRAAAASTRPSRDGNKKNPHLRRRHHPFGRRGTRRGPERTARSSSTRPRQRRRRCTPPPPAHRPPRLSPTASRSRRGRRRAPRTTRSSTRRLEAGARGSPPARETSSRRFRLRPLRPRHAPVAPDDRPCRARHEVRAPGERAAPLASFVASKADVLGAKTRRNPLRWRFSRPARAVCDISEGPSRTRARADCDGARWAKRAGSERGATRDPSRRRFRRSRAVPLARRASSRGLGKRKKKHSADRARVRGRHADRRVQLVPDRRRRRVLGGGDHDQRVHPGALPAPRGPEPGVVPQARCGTRARRSHLTRPSPPRRIRRRPLLFFKDRKRSTIVS